MVGQYVVIEENGPFFEVEIIEHSEEIELGEVIEIEYSVTNNGDATGTQDIILTVKAEEVDIEEEERHEDVTLEPGEYEKWNYQYDTGPIGEDYGQQIFEIEVDVEIIVQSDDDVTSGTTTVKSEGLIPGFTFVSLVLGISFAVMIYYTKKS